MQLQQPWRRQAHPELIPDDVTRGDLFGMPEERFTRLIRDNLQPLNNDPQRWQMLWRLLTRDGHLSERAFNVLEELEEQAVSEQQHLPDLTDVERKRIAKFLRNIETCWNKLEDDGQQRLRWAGRAGKFPKQDQITIQVLVMAIDRHRAATVALGRSEAIDADLWEAVDRAGAEHVPDIADLEMTGERVRGAEKVESVLVSAIRAHAEATRSGDVSQEQCEELWGALKEVDLDPAVHHRRAEQRRRAERSQ